MTFKDPNGAYLNTKAL